MHLIRDIAKLCLLLTNIALGGRHAAGCIGNGRGIGTLRAFIKHSVLVSRIILIKTDGTFLTLLRLGIFKVLSILTEN